MRKEMKEEEAIARLKKNGVVVDQAKKAIHTKPNMGLKLWGCVDCLKNLFGYKMAK